MASTGLSSATKPDVGAATRELAAPSVLVGIVSYDDAETIGEVVRRAKTGLASRGSPACLVLADGGSTDRTLECAREVVGEPNLIATEYARPTPDPLSAPYHGWPGRAAAIRAVLRTARDQEASACALIDARLTSLSPDWIPRLLEAVVKDDFDYVAPCYQRHPHEGAITKSLIYPLFRALYGVRIRQPAAGEFGCSLRLVKHILDQGFWEANDAETGADLWMASAAAVGGFRVCETMLGNRTHASKEELPDVSTALAQVVGAMFTDMEAHAETWQRVRGSVAAPAFGTPPAEEVSLPPIDVEPMLEGFRLGFRALRDIWAWVVPPRTMLELKKLADAPVGRFHLDDALWTQIVYDFALAYRARSMPRDHLLGALAPLYLGWLAAFVMETRGAAEVEARVEQLCLVFEAKKPYLIAGWRWPERFRA